MPTLQELITELRLPLSFVPSGTIRVAGTRVSLDTVIETFEEGATPEEIVASFPVLLLADVYDIIAFYLRHRETVKAYIDSENVHADELMRSIGNRKSQHGLRDRLLSRQKHRDGV